MNATKVWSVRLNDGFFMPVLGFGTSTPSKVVTAASEAEGQWTCVLIRTTIWEMQAGLVFFVMLLSSLGYFVHEVSDFQILISTKTQRILLKMQIWGLHPQRFQTSRSGMGLQNPHF